MLAVERPYGVEFPILIDGVSQRVGVRTQAVLADSFRSLSTVVLSREALSVPAF